MADPLDELYLGDFEGFVKRRNELAKRLRSKGDEEEADRVKALAKPSRIAWSINQLSDREPKLRDRLLKAGAALRAAQDELVSGSADAASFRQARAKERSVVAEAMEAVEALVADAGATLSAAASERARQTLHAVALDDEVRGDFEAHRLESDREATGLTGVPAASAGGLKPRAHNRKKAADDSRRRRREELKAAESDLREREGEQVKAEQARDAARTQAQTAQRELDKATKVLEQREAATATAKARVEELRSEPGA